MNLPWWASIFRRFSIVLFGILGALATRCVEPYRLSGWFANPPWVFMALIVIYVCLLLPFGMVL